MRSSATAPRRTRRRRALGLLSGLLVAAVGCAGGEATSATEASAASTTGSTGDASTDDATTTTTTGTQSDTDVETTGDAGAADGEPCAVHVDCASRLCLEFRDHDPSATCAPAPEGGSTRFTGTILDITAGAELVGAELRVLDALTALQNPAGAPVLLSATSDAQGRVDATSEERIPVGVGLVGLVVGEGLTPTTGAISDPLANGAFGPGNTYHDLWAAPSEALAAWEAMLAADPEVAPHLPLASGGAALGLVRRAATGAPQAGATLVSEEAASAALVRYLNEGRDAFDGEATASHGLFVVVHAGLAEGFAVEVAGEVVEGVRVEARSAPGSVGAMLVALPE
ncbi:MAG: hypothetical protein R3A79_10630 [Nannocystaceae bacterium]